LSFERSIVAALIALTMLSISFVSLFFKEIITKIKFYSVVYVGP